MHLDMTITLGNIVEIGTIAMGIMLAYTKLKERLVAIEVQLKPLWEEFTSERRQYPRRAEDRG